MIGWFKRKLEERRVAKAARRAVSKIRIRRWLNDLANQVEDGALFSEALVNLGYDVKAEAKASDRPKQVLEDFTTLISALKTHNTEPNTHDSK